MQRRMSAGTCVTRLSFSLLSPLSCCSFFLVLLIHETLQTAHLPLRRIASSYPRFFAFRNSASQHGAVASGEFAAWQLPDGTGPSYDEGLIVRGPLEPVVVVHGHGSGKYRRREEAELE